MIPVLPLLLRSATLAAALERKAQLQGGLKLHVLEHSMHGASLLHLHSFAWIRGRKPNMGPPTAVGGVGALDHEDVARLARAIVAVVLDTAASERLKKDSPPKGTKLFGIIADAAAETADTAATSWLSASHARAVLLARLLPLVNGRSKTRLGVIELILRLLQPEAQLDQVLPAAPDADAMQRLAAALPQRAATSGGLSAAERAVVDSGGLTADERAALATGQPVAAGLAAVAIADLRQLLTATAAVTALSAEALQADVSGHVPVALCESGVGKHAQNTNQTRHACICSHSYMHPVSLPS